MEHELEQSRLLPSPSATIRKLLIRFSELGIKRLLPKVKIFARQRGTRP
jgi:hypothetical protein